MTPATMLWTPAYRPPEDLPQTGQQSLFTITGLVRLHYLCARVTTVLGASASVLKFVYDPTMAGANTDLCAAAAMSALAAGNWFFCWGFFLAATPLKASTGGGSPQDASGFTPMRFNPVHLPAGAILLDASGVQTGQAEYYAGWQAVTPGSSLVVTP